MKKLSAIILFLMFIVSGVSAQVTVSGIVIDKEDGSAMAGVNVTLRDSLNKIKSFATTDAQGRFSMKTRTVEGMKVKATFMGYGEQTVTPVGDAPLRIEMEPAAFQLKEVAVKADRIREQGDTITYHVASFAQKQDHTIGDVLKRMPGIDVNNAGKIQYQGTDINKFYIEGNDLLGGRYGVATNGIAHDDIKSVEVMENHQPMQVLRGLSFSDQAAINLKMKNSAKATFIAHGTLSGGWSDQPAGALWNGEIFTMMVMGKYQMLTTFKGNNTGLDLSGQVFDFTADRSSEELTGYTSVGAPSTPNLARKRSYFNRSWMVSSSHLWKTKKGSDIRLQLDYNNDRVTAQGMSATTYFLESGDKVILEDRNSLSHRNAIKGKFIYEANEKTYFLNNTLSADLSWNDLRLNTTGSLPNVQSTRNPEYSVTNDLKIIKRFGRNRLITFTSRNEWNSLPEHLTVSRDGGEAYGQQVKQYSFYTDERASYGLVLNRVLLSLEGGLTGYFRHLDTDLWGVELEGITGSEGLTTDYLRVYASPKFEWSHRKVELTLGLPVNFYTYFFSGALADRSEFFISPSLSAKWKITPRMSLRLSGSARRSPASLHNIHDASILTDYRTFNSGTDDYYTSSGQAVSISYMFRNARKGIFVNALGRYSWNRSKFGSVQNILGDYIFYSYTSQPSSSRGVLAYANVSKTLDFMRGAIGVNTNYNRNENNMWSQGLATNYINDSFSLAPHVNGNISSFVNWNFRFTWRKEFLKISEMPRQTTDNFIYSGSLTVTPCRLVTWTTGGEYYRNQIEADNYKNMFMLDSKLTFNITKRLELSASLTNILNRKEYSYTSFGTLSQYERSSRLRGREFMISVYLKK
ncbi:TonB-dependent receptor [uncultured Duncaniella sp.]|uniref:TonB-dependent receptor n=1 Tax=uncultured Duncaniella sp. TaxID=2768039 RepID=UPI000F464714|nr:TonB-dependent receptor [uncultured Duncaniella sp.]ROS86026.1 hypothetical protein EEL39_14895 [Muribaculaceae bacterium Isolate-080 (Janvier)]